MTRTAYYEAMKDLARKVRAKFGLNTPRVGLGDLRRIYKAEGVRIDLWPHKLKDLRGAYFNDQHGPSVLIAKGLPADPRAFTMAHELKHHLCDQDLAVAYCDPSNQDSKIEIGAEVFAAELLLPEEMFLASLGDLGVEGACGPEDLVRLKRRTRTTLSYAGLAKRAVWLGLCQHSAVEKVKWKKLEEKLFGVPFYKRRH